jgi:hypothetical protein
VQDSTLTFNPPELDFIELLLCKLCTLDAGKKAFMLAFVMHCKKEENVQRGNAVT